MIKHLSRLIIQGILIFYFLPEGYSGIAYSIDTVYQISGQQCWILNGTVDHENNYLFTGFSVDTTVIGSASYPGKWKEDLVVGKIGEDGNLVWFKKFGVSKSLEASGIAVDRENNVILSGSFEDSLAISEHDTVASTSVRSAFLIKLTVSGDLEWHYELPNDPQSQFVSVAADNSNNIFVTGFTYEEIDFGTDHLDLKGEYDLIMLKFDPQGNPVYGVSYGGSGGDFGTV